MITGLLGLRTMAFRQGAWGSPSHSDFEWNTAMAWADCSKGCPKDEEGHVIIRESCTCGIHATLWPDEFVDYMKKSTSVGFLVEAHGWIVQPGMAHTWMHEYGFTSSGAQIVGVVNWTRLGKAAGWNQYSTGEASILLTKQRLAQQSAAKFFDVPILDIQVAVLMLKMQWEKLGGIWPSEIRSAWQSID